jgi:hypothetical protein
MKEKLKSMWNKQYYKKSKDLYRGISEFKKEYKKNKLVKDETGDLLADYHSI